MDLIFFAAIVPLLAELPELELSTWVDHHVVGLRACDIAEADGVTAPIISRRLKKADALIAAYLERHPETAGALQAWTYVAEAA